MHELNVPGRHVGRAGAPGVAGAAGAPGNPGDPGRGGGGTPPRWRAARLLESPHRLCFFWGGVQWALAAAWWLAGLAAAARGVPWPWQVPPALAHGLWFSLGAMPLFIAGFMCTAGPKWLRCPPVAASRLRWSVALFSAGWALALPGWHVSVALAAVGLALVAAGWAGLVWRIGALVAASAQADRRHAWLIAAACTLLLVCLLAAALALAGQRVDLLRPLLRVALWGGLLAVFLAASHRLLPFLGGGAWPWLDARWPDAPLWLLLSVPLAQAVAALAAVAPTGPAGWGAGVLGAMPGRGPVVLDGLAAAHLAVVAALGLRLLWGWRGQPALRQPLVGMLFLAFVWCDVALWLAAAARWPGLDGASAALLDLAALHTLAIGYLGGTLLAMATRVSSTQGGRPVAIDRVARVLHALLQLALVLRLAVLLALLQFPITAAPWLPWAAAAWLAVAAGWALRHGRWLGLPRAGRAPVQRAARPSPGAGAG